MRRYQRFWVKSQVEVGWVLHGSPSEFALSSKRDGRMPEQRVSGVEKQILDALGLELHHRDVGESRGSLKGLEKSLTILEVGERFPRCIV